MPPPKTFSFWQGRLPAGGAPRRPPIDDELLIVLADRYVQLARDAGALATGGIGTALAPIYVRHQAGGAPHVIVPEHGAEGEGDDRDQVGDQPEVHRTGRRHAGVSSRGRAGGS